MDGKFESKGSDPFTKFDDEVKSFHILNERKANCTRFIKVAEKNRGGVKPHIYEKVTADYEARLAEVMREWRPLVEGIIRKLQDSNHEKVKIERGIIETADSLDELRFRILVGEFEEELERERENDYTESIEDMRLRLSVLQRKIDYYNELKAEIPPEDLPADPVRTEPESPAAAPLEVGSEQTRVVNIGFQGEQRQEQAPVEFSCGDQSLVDPAFDLESSMSEESPERPADSHASNGFEDAFEIMDEGFDEDSLPVLELKLDR